MKLTKTEYEILEHRLSVDDAISDVLESDEDQTLDICQLFINNKWEDAFGLNKELAREVLIEALEGSTYYGCHSLCSNQKLAGIQRSMQSLGRKLEKYLDVEYIQVPLY